MSHQTTIEINGDEFIVIAEYEYFKASRGKRGSYGEPLEPDESAHVEVHSVKIDHSGNGEAPEFHLIELPEIVINEIEQEIMEEYQ